jgi:tetraacyldisaccharide 4'-kinase
MREREDYFRGVISGRERGLGAALLRGAARLAEPFYRLGVSVRNWTFDARLRRAHVAPRPVICVGNITTGGTGKTPVVCWLAAELRRRGHRPAVIMRGYKGEASRDGAIGSDEQRLLEELLRDPALPSVPVVTDADRVRGARRAVEIDPQVTVILLDDGFQHRRLRRDFDLVLIDASNPFGHGHLLPRGLLREPLSGLRRAHALLLTHVEAVDAARVVEIERELRRHNPFAPLYRCRHALGGFITSDEHPQPPDLRGRRYLAFCGIGNPQAFARQLESLGGLPAASHFFGDHHAYREADLEMLEKLASSVSSEMMVTTEKDWVKVRALSRATSVRPTIWRAALGVEFDEGDGPRLIEQLLARIDAVSRRDTE